MKNIFLFSLIAFLSFSCKSDKKSKNKIELKTTNYYLIRHAEKDRSVISDDPKLTEEGIKRADKWATYFNDVDLDLIYSTDYKRTQQTAQPTATIKNIEILSYDSRNLYDEAFQINTKYKNVLIVGHSNTTPAFVNIIIGKQKYDQINDKDNGKLYRVTLTKNDTLVAINDYN